jgi:mono/diheme cytochrome c family protein
MRIQAIRASETLYKAGDRSFMGDYRALAKDPDTDVVIQAMLTLNLFKVPDLTSVIEATRAADPARGVQEVGAQMLRPATTLTGGGGRGRFTTEQQSTLQRGETIYKELCFTCHGPDGRGEQAEGEAVVRAPSLVSSRRIQGHRDYVIKSIMHGLAGPIDGLNYTQVMVPMGTNRDDWIAAVGSYVRNAFGNSASIITPEDVARVRAATADRKTMWTVEELEASLPVPLLAENWTASASHNQESAAGGLNFAGWSTEEPQAPGMWFLIELPEPAVITEIEFMSTSQGGGRGGAPPTVLYPRAYRVQVSMDGEQWSASVAEGRGTGAITTIEFEPVRARFVRITQTAAAENAPAWAVQRLRLFRPPSGSSAGR